jgi:hypothetical protein
LGNYDCQYYFGIVVYNYLINTHRHFFKKKISDEPHRYSGLKLSLIIDDESEFYESEKKKLKPETRTNTKEYFPKNKTFDQFDAFEKNMDELFKTTNIIRLILRWKWPLLIIFLVALIASSVLSGPYFIKPKYKSFAIVYPANLTPYSDENNTEQLLQVLQSEDLLFQIAKDFKLAKDYGLDTTDYLFRSKLMKKLSENVFIKRTEFESVMIEVYDYDANRAYKMVFALIDLMNYKIRNMHQEKAAEMVNLYKFELDQKQHQIDSIEGRLQFLRKEYNILEYKTQVKEYSKGFVKSITSGHKNPPVEINNTLTNLKEHGGEYTLLESYLWGLTNDYNQIKSEYDKAITDFNKKLTYSSVVTNPIAADKKSKPIRWLIVTITTASSLLLGLILFSIFGNPVRKDENNQ